MAVLLHTHYIHVPINVSPEYIILTLSSNAGLNTQVLGELGFFTFLLFRSFNVSRISTWSHSITLMFLSVQACSSTADFSSLIGESACHLVLLDPGVGVPSSLAYVGVPTQAVYLVYHSTSTGSFTFCQ